MRAGCNPRSGASPGCRALEEDRDKGGRSQDGGGVLEEIREVRRNYLTDF